MFNSTDYTTLEVKFTQSDLLEESKKKAIETYDENNKCLGLIFNTGVEPYSENSDLDEDCIPEVPTLNISEEVNQLTSGFREVINYLRHGDISKAEDLGKNLGLFNADHPSISFLPQNHTKRREKLASSRNQLPWTSADSITIFPL
jgi:hypothetical protein